MSLTIEELLKEFLEAFSKADNPAKRLEITNAYEMKFGGHGYQRLVWDEESQSGWVEKKVPEAS